MSHFPKVIKRILAMVLAMALLLSCGNFGLIAQVYAQGDDDHDHAHISLGQLIVGNYDGLTDDEKAIIKSGWLNGDAEYAFIAPPAEVFDGGLITVDEDNKGINSLFLDNRFSCKTASETLHYCVNRNILRNSDSVPYSCIQNNGNHQLCYGVQ